MSMMLVVGAFGLKIAAVLGPLTCDQVPVPTVGVLPAIVAEPEVVQIVWSPPALAGVTAVVKAMTTSSLDAVQGALAIVQRKVYVPATDTVTLVVGALALAKLAVPGPLNSVQIPVPVVAVLPARFVVRLQGLAFEPALAAVGGALTTMETCDVLAGQPGLEMAHWNT